MDAGVAADDHAIFDDRVSTEHRALGKHDVVRQLAVVAGVGAVHEEVVVADLRGIGLVDRSMDRRVLAEDVAIPDQRPGPFDVRVEVDWSGVRRPGS